MRVLVTGGGSDIGRSIVKRRLALGDEVIVTSSSAEGTARLVAEFQTEGLRVEGLAFDLAAPEQAAEALAESQARAPIEGLVLNACTRTPATHRFHEMSEEKVAGVINANILGNGWLIRQLLPAMMEQRFGRIVFISSVSAINGTGRYATYIMAKAALEGLMNNLAVDYGEFNILANTARLGIFKTSRNKKYWSKDWYREKMSAIIPQNALGEPEQIGEALDPLLAKNQYINGSVLTIGGGFPMVRLEGVIKS